MGTFDEYVKIYGTVWIMDNALVELAFKHKPCAALLHGRKCMQANMIDRDQNEYIVRWFDVDWSRDGNLCFAVNWDYYQVDKQFGDYAILHSDHMERLR